MRYEIKREKHDLVKFMKTKSEKVGLKCTIEGDRIKVEAQPGDSSATQTPIPVEFKGRIKKDDDKTIIEGKYGYGFNLTTLGIVAAVLIAVRLAWSIYQKQTSNIILCGIVTALLIVVVMVAGRVGKPLKTKIEEFFGDLEKVK